MPSMKRSIILTSLLFFICTFGGVKMVHAQPYRPNLAFAYSIAIAVSLLGTAKAEADSYAKSTGGGAAVSVTLAIAISGLQEIRDLALRGESNWAQIASIKLNNTVGTLSSVGPQLATTGWSNAQSGSVLQKVAGATAKIGEANGYL